MKGGNWRSIFTGKMHFKHLQKLRAEWVNGLDPIFKPQVITGVTATKIKIPVRVPDSKVPL